MVDIDISTLLLKIRMEHPLRKYRTAHGLKLRQIAELTGLTVPYLSQIETGVRDPSKKTIAVICNRTGLSPAVFFASPPPINPDADCASALHRKD